MQNKTFLNKDGYVELVVRLPVPEVSKLIILAIGKSGNTKIFKNHTEAEEWLVGR